MRTAIDAALSADGSATARGRKHAIACTIFRSSSPGTAAHSPAPG